jgi:hypothetical protein
MATTIKLKNGSGAPLAGDLVQGEPALDLTNKRLYTEDSGGTVIEVGTNPTSLTTGTFTSTGIDDNATSTAITIDASENVGIGTASPDSILHLSGTSGSKIIIEDSANPRQNYIGIDSSDNLVLAADEDNLGTSSNIQFRVDATERMRIDSSGNLGIGTTSPTEQLHIANANDAVVLVESTGSDATDDANIQLKTTNGTFTLQNDRSIGTTGALTIAGATSNNIVVDHTSGNVGIGTASPATLLHLNSASDTYFTIGTTNATADARIQFRNSGGTDAGGLWYATNGNNMLFRTNSAERMRIDSSGNVGIGTTSPTGFSGYTSLDINNATNGALIDLSQGDAMKGRLIATASTMAIETAASVPILFQPAGTERMRIDTSGNLLVGKTSASTSTVGGEINSDGTLVAVRASGNPLLLNRTTTDGAIATFRKDNTTVGVIGTSGGDLTIYSTAAGHCGLRFLGDPAIAPVNNSGVLVDNSIDIGEPSNRFKDLYLSGGAYLGGTGSANYLDDYEEGTWTPTHGGNNMTGTAVYRKIGSAVMVHFDVTSAAGSSSSTRIGGIPFGLSSLHGAWHVGYQSASGTHVGGYVDSVTAELVSIAQGSTSGVNLNAGERLIGFAYYIAP